VFESIEYLEWIDGRIPEATHDFASSGIGDDPGDGVVPASLQGLSDPDDDRTLAARIADAYGPAVGEENVLVTAGATHANFLAVAAALDEHATESDDAGVLVEEPAYEPLLKTPRALGATVDRFTRDRSEQYALDPEAVAASVSTDTALTVVTNRHNPSGALTDRDTLAEAGEAVGNAGGRLLVDEVYAPYVTDAHSGDGAAFGGPTAAGLDGVVVTSSLTKYLGLGGVRIGWLIGDEPFVDAARRTRWHVPAVAEPSVKLAARALEHRDTLAAQSRERLRENHALLADFLDERDDIRGFVPEGSSIAFLAHDRADGTELYETAEERGILVVPGRYYENPDWFRITLGRHPDAMAEGLDALAAVCDDL
jgi:aspartate/methionine/tyrosine aminotransferase